MSGSPSASRFLMSVYNISKDQLYSSGERIYTWDRNKFSWYALYVSSATYQLNKSGQKYCYITF